MFSVVKGEPFSDTNSWSTVVQNKVFVTKPPPFSAPFAFKHRFSIGPNRVSEAFPLGRSQGGNREICRKSRDFSQEPYELLAARDPRGLGVLGSWARSGGSFFGGLGWEPPPPPPVFFFLIFFLLLLLFLFRSGQCLFFWPSSLRVSGWPGRVCVESPDVDQRGRLEVAPGTSPHDFWPRKVPPLLFCFETTIFWSLCCFLPSLS